MHDGAAAGAQEAVEVVEDGRVAGDDQDRGRGVRIGGCHWEGLARSAARCRGAPGPRDRVPACDRAEKPGVLAGRARTA